MARDKPSRIGHIVKETEECHMLTGFVSKIEHCCIGLTAKSVV